MEIRFQAGTSAAEAVILPLFQGERPDFPSLESALPWLKDSLGLADFQGGKAETLLLHAPRADAPRAFLAGLGRREAFTPKALGEALAVAVKALAERRLGRLALPLAALRGLAGEGEYPRLLEEAALGAGLGLYAYTKCKSAPEEGEAFRPVLLNLLLVGERPDREEEAARRKALALIQGITLARDIINGPANLVTPQYLESRAEDLARRCGFACTAYGPDQLREKGLAAFLAVSRGAETEPRLLILEHCPPGRAGEDPLVLVGKGVTFDSGGISLKPAAGMERMKRDMAGAGALLGLFAALGAGGPDFARRRVMAFMPCAENMPGGRATRPGDIVRTLSGKTVEISNTDAEGRLLLCDSMTLAQEMVRPSAIIDIATLTGACVVALGEKTAGIFGNDPALTRKLLALAGKNGERFWAMPVWDEDIAVLREKCAADLNNAGPREGGASLAALFLKQFIREGIPWAHLDIAGPAWQSQDEPGRPGGATAFGLRTLLDFVLDGGVF